MESSGFCAGARRYHVIIDLVWLIFSSVPHLPHLFLLLHFRFPLLHILDWIFTFFLKKILTCEIL